MQSVDQRRMFLLPLSGEGEPLLGFSALHKVHDCHEGIQHTWIMERFCLDAQLLVKFGRIFTNQRLRFRNAENLEVFSERRSNVDDLLESVT